MKRIILALCAFLMLSSGFGEIISRVGVVDLSTIFSQYFRESVSFRKIEELQKTYEDERRRIISQIDLLKEDKLSAQRRGTSLWRCELRKRSTRSRST